MSHTTSLPHLAILLIIASVITTCTCEEPEKIVGGRNARPDEFPYYASLRYRGEHLCGGSIISKKHILTAAHCVYELIPIRPGVEIVTGVTYLRHGGNVHRVKDAIYHESYVPGQEASWFNDVAVISLEDEITINAHQRPIRISENRLPSNVEAVVSGFGLTTVNGSLSEQLKTTPMQILDNPTCKTLVRPKPLYPSHICAFHSMGVGICNGDSGGPLVHKNEVVGIVSWAFPCALGLPDVYTRVSHYAGWIKNAMATLR